MHLFFPLQVDKVKIYECGGNLVDKSEISNLIWRSTNTISTLNLTQVMSTLSQHQNLVTSEDDTFEIKVTEVDLECEHSLTKCTLLK